MPELSDSGRNLSRFGATIALGAAGPVIEVLGHGAIGKWGALILACGALAVEGVLRSSSSSRGRSRVVALGIVAVATAGLSSPLVGRAPAAMVLLGIFIADAAMWGTLNRDGRPVAVAIPVLALAQVTWLRDPRTTLMVALLGSAAAIVLLDRAGVNRIRRASSLVAEYSTRWALGAAVAAFAIVALPFLYLPGAAIRATSKLHGLFRRHQSISTWTDVASIRQSSDHANRPFVVAPSAVAFRRNLAGAIGLAVTAAAVLLAVSSLGSQQTEAELAAIPTESGAADGAVRSALEALEAVPYSSRAAYAGVTFADELQREFQRVPLIAGGASDYRLGDFSGRYVNVTDGVRRTPRPPCACDRRAKIYWVGGSAAFGLGQRDDHTIAAELARLAAADGLELEVVNLAVPGWTLRQERAAVLERLRIDDTPPDLIIFFDGFNDVVGTVVESSLRAPDPALPASLDPSAVETFVQRAVDGAPPVDGVELGAIAAERYRRQIPGISQEIAQHGSRARFFFQPDAFVGSIQRRPVDSLYRTQSSLPLLHDAADLPDALDVAAKALEPAVTNLRDTLAHHPLPVFADSVHSNEAGAELIAAATYRQLKHDLERVSG